MAFALRLFTFSVLLLAAILASCENYAVAAARAAAPHSGMVHAVPHLRHCTRSHADSSGATDCAAGPGTSSSPVAMILKRA